MAVAGAVPAERMERPETVPPFKSLCVTGATRSPAARPVTRLTKHLLQGKKVSERREWGLALHRNL